MKDSQFIIYRNEVLDCGEKRSRRCEKEIHIAPMLDVSKREFRQFLRILSKRCVLWTEMIVDETLSYSEDPSYHLDFEPNTHPIVVQIGGNSPPMTASGVTLMQKWGYDEINLNCGCPSDRVSGKRDFGAALMKKPDLTLQMLKSMHNNINNNNNNTPISLKIRIGVDDFDHYDFLHGYIANLLPYCNRFILHARKVILKGLSPAQNRRIPPLNYARVYRLCRDFPHCHFWINGGITGLRTAKHICDGRPDIDQALHSGVPCLTCDAPFGSCIAPPPSPAPPNLMGCMFGRAAIDNPSMFWDVDRFFYGEPNNPCQNRREVLDKYCHYLKTIYPPRCRDDDHDTITARLPAPKTVQVRSWCKVCSPPAKGDEHDNNNHHQHQTSPLDSDRVKIASRVVDRALKPVLGIFVNMKGSKRFRQACFSLARDLAIRNCGPAFILQKAMESVPPHILDSPFVKTEDLPV
eukprot:CAMPEP_0202477650 /NCGR_PEP_ID=MMETSP1360-20130828/94046_1 /ASSEMBLY_ACC=CAM_ASM_000848 /TAXON_ID=515479 /ORGANISM="Licmophora paradoxa, Strain CCMP2313" /LENGTH=463 /DNA_ID=CAMNT_0049104899 /DNA_START=63 /DNA_END=1454 /DNA_ORIENTATION=+